MVSTLMGLGAIPVDHPLYLGMLGMHGAPYTNMILEECDLLIVAGARFDDRATGKLEEFCPNAAVLHMDADAAEINKLRRVQLAMTGDAGQILKKLIPAIPENRNSEWLERINHIRGNRANAGYGSRAHRRSSH